MTPHVSRRRRNKLYAALGALTLLAGTTILVPNEMDGFALAATAPASAGLTVERLRTEDTDRPLGLDRQDVELSWRLASKVRGLGQAAYEVEVASSMAQLRAGRADVWRSGKVASAQPWMRYGGPKLVTAGRYFWRVRIWDDNGRVSKWSAPSEWEMGLLDAADWGGARWIRVAGADAKEKLFAGHHMRKQFTVTGKVRSARLYYSATGWVRHCAPAQVIPQACKPAAAMVVPTLNGMRANDHQLDPAPTDVERALYTSTDVTAQIRRGENALGLTIASDSDVIAKLVIETIDGRTQTITSDASWTTHESATLKADRFAGVTYDARRATPGWDTGAFKPGAGWVAVQDASPRVGQIILASASYMPPMRVVKRWKPVAITETTPGNYTIDFGQNITGRTRFRARGTAGDTIKIIHSEKRTAKKEADPRGTGFQGFQTDSYTFDEKAADWSPEFAYYGFRYVTISGLKSAPKAADIWAEQVNTDLAHTGELDTSDPLINKIHVAAIQTTLNNAHGIPEDCPHREKRGWSADAYVSDPQAFANFDMEGFYDKFLQDIRDAQQPNGSIPDIAPPELSYARGNGDSIWGAVGTELPWDLYEQTGDIEVIQTSYPSMKAFVDWSVSIAKNNAIESGKYRGDWVAFKASHDPLLRTAFYYRSVRRLIDGARVLGKDEDVRKYEALASEIRKSFNERFLDRATGTYGVPGKQATTMTQATQALPIAFGLVPDDMRPAVAAQLVRYITDVSKLHVESGLNATRYVLDALQMIDRPDIIHAMATQTDAPGWAHMVNTGPGTLWESWKGGSLQHAWPGVIDAHFYRTYGGIESTAPGFRTMVIRPYVPNSMSWARAVRDTPYGPVRSEWRKSGSALRLDVTVPIGTTARVVLPVRAGTRPTLTVDGRRTSNFDAIRGVSKVSSDERSITLEVVSGRYAFDS